MKDLLSMMTVQGASQSIKERLSTTQGKHILKSVSSKVSNDGKGNPFVRFLWEHNISPDTKKIADALRFSSYSNFMKSFNRIKYVYDHITGTKAYLNSKIVDGTLPEVTEIAMRTTETNEKEPIVYSFDHTTTTKEQRAESINDIKIGLGSDDWELKFIEDSNYSTYDNDKNCLKSSYLAVRLNPEATQVFIDKIVELSQESVVGKLINVVPSDTEGGFQNVESYSKV